MTRFRCTTVIFKSSDRDPISSSIHGDCITRSVIRCFAINVCPYLCPRTGCVFIDAHVTRVGSSAVIDISTDRDPITGSIHGDRPARLVICCFAINVTTELRPRTGGVFVDAHMTCIRCGAVIFKSSDRDPISGSVEGNGSARVVIRCFPINVTT